MQLDKNNPRINPLLTPNLVLIGESRIHYMRIMKSIAPPPLNGATLVRN